MSSKGSSLIMASLSLSSASVDNCAGYIACGIARRTHVRPQAAEVAQLRRRGHIVFPAQLQRLALKTRRYQRIDSFPQVKVASERVNKDDVSAMRRSVPLPKDPGTADGNDVAGRWHGVRSTWSRAA